MARDSDGRFGAAADWGAYPVDDAALAYGAGVDEETSNKSAANARFPRRVSVGYRPERCRQVAARSITSSKATRRDSSSSARARRREAASVMPASSYAATRGVQKLCRRRPVTRPPVRRAKIVCRRLIAARAAMTALARLVFESSRLDADAADLVFARA
jgi:hypothetical protein